MAPSNTAVTESMQRITETKLEALDKQHTTHEKIKTQILDKVDKEKLVSERIRILLDHLEEYKIGLPTGLRASVIRAFLEQSRHDPSVSPVLLESWESALRRSLELPSRKFQHAHLFGRLAMEWLKSGEGETPGADMGDSFESVGRKEMYDQRKEWEKLVFEDRPEPDAKVIQNYLSGLFNATVEVQVKYLQKQIGDFELEHLTPSAVKSTISHLINSDLLSHGKQAALKDLLANETIHSEIADVLNMQIDSLKSWSWGSEPVSLDVRRGLNGKYRVFMDEELLTAILLQYIGLHWSVHLKNSLRTFMRSDAWDKTFGSATSIAGARGAGRGRKPRPKAIYRSVNTHRWNTYAEEYFMQQLPDSIFEDVAGYGENVSPDQVDQTKSFATKKQELFHLITTDALVTSQLHGSWTILQSDFRWFGPSLAHTTIIEVLKFLGVKDSWLEFFRKYLQPPLRFAMDGDSATTFTRKSGVPISHSLTDFMGEAVLFCLDFAVNSNAGRNLHRVHDDIWFWGSQEATIRVWNTLQTFCEVTGLRLNEEKTGVAQVIRSGEAKPGTLPKSIPCTPVKWGFLIFDSTTGCWKMNDEQVREHIAELRLQLDATKSIFAWVQAWNTYVTHFLANNFGTPANCLGQQHVDMVIQTFNRIQTELFSSSSKSASKPKITPTNVTQYLKSELASRFNVPPYIPDGILYFPLELGGLALRNPLIPLLLLRPSAPESPTDIVTTALQADKADYNALARAHAAGEEDTPRLRELCHKDGSLLSWEEVRSFAESSSTRLADAYEELRERPADMEVWLGNDVKGALDELSASDAEGGNGRGKDGDSALWASEGYWRWVLQLYGGEVLGEFGGLAMGERRLLPLGLVRMMREARVRWLG